MPIYIFLGQSLTVIRTIIDCYKDNFFGKLENFVWFIT